MYQLPNSGLKLSQVYSTLEQIREDLCRESTSSAIEDYSLSQTTLDDVFIHFASQQSEEEGLLEAAVGASVGGKDSLHVIGASRSEPHTTEFYAFLGILLLLYLYVSVRPLTKCACVKCFT